MRVLVSASAHFALTADGALWTPNASLGHTFWARYLDVFDEVRLLVRARPCATPPEGWNPATRDGITAVPLPDSIGPLGFVKDFTRIRRIVREALTDAEAVQLRISCHIGGEVWRQLPPRRPYGVEVVTDPYDVFAPGAVRHPLRGVFRWWFTRQLRQQCAGACAAAYVTERALQRRYPPAPEACTTHFSSIELPDTAFVEVPRPARPARNLILVGTLAQLYKAPDVLLEAFGQCVREGLDLRLRFVGDGKHRPELQARAEALGLAERVCFRGQLTAGDPVRQELDWADLLVLPSRQEGLPRAMIEAMARALPCIGSTVGGIPELLPPEDLVPPGDVAALTRKLREVVTAPERLAAMSARNLSQARNYSDNLLRPRRIAFYEHLRAETARWLRASVGCVR